MVHRCMSPKHMILRRLLCFLFCMLVVSFRAVGLELTRTPDSWVVKSFEPPFRSISNVRELVVQPLEETATKWLICVMVPDLKDPAWRGINFGVVERAKQLNISLFVLSAGGYLNSQTQKEQFDVCVDRNPDAIVLGPTNEKSLVDKVKELNGRIPVFILMNEFPTDIIQGWVGPSWYENESKLLSVAKDFHRDQKLLWLNSLGGSKDSLQGVVDSANSLGMRVVMSKEADNTFESHQSNLMKILAEHPEISDVAGPAMAIEYTSYFLRKNYPESEIGLYASYYIPSLYRLIKQKRVIASIDQRAVLAGLISIEMAIRYLEGKRLPKYVDVTGEVLTHKNIDEIDRYYSNPPYGWQGVYSYNYELPYANSPREPHTEQKSSKKEIELNTNKSDRKPIPKELRVVSWPDKDSLKGQQTISQYSFLKTSSRNWTLCALYPNLYDDYWLSINYGMVHQATKLGVELFVYEASGYHGINEQREQIVECLKHNADAIILGATSGELLRSDIEKAAQSTPVFSIVNYIPNEYIAGRVGVSWYEVGLNSAELLYDKVMQQSGIDSIAWLGSPKGLGSSKALQEGILDGLAGHGKTVAYTSNSPNTAEAKRTEIKKMLRRHSDVDCIVAGGPAITALLAEKAQHRLDEDVCLIADHFGHSVFRGLKRGRVSAAISDQMVAQGMLSIDQAVRHLEGKAYLKNMGPEILQVTPGNLNDLSVFFSLNPVEFQATFYVPPRDRS